MHPARGGRPFDEVGTSFRALEGQVGVVLPIGKPRAADAEARQSSRPRAGFILRALALDVLVRDYGSVCKPKPISNLSFSRPQSPSASSCSAASWRDRQAMHRQPRGLRPSRYTDHAGRSQSASPVPRYANGREAVVLPCRLDIAVIELGGVAHGLFGECGPCFSNRYDNILLPIGSRIFDISK